MKSKQLNGRVIRMAVASALALGSSTLGVNSYATTSVPSNLTVTATVAPNCTINTTPLAFGTYDPVTANSASVLNGTGTVIVTCTNGTGATITMGEGLNPKFPGNTALPQRQMANGANRLSYALFSDAARSNVWSTTGVSHTGNGLPATLTVYGTVDAGQNVPAGPYSDTVVATITF
jgi:spore coat protein U-like protein